MKSKTTTILLATSLVLVAGAQAATLLQNSGYTVATTEVHYDFNNTNKNVREALTTDASGNGRILTGGNNPGNKWGGTGEIIVSDYAYSYVMSNTTGMAADNYQVTIHLIPEPNWPSPNGKMVIYYYDGVELSYNADTYTATVGGNTVGTFTAGSAGIMLQKMNGSFSLWSTNYSADGTAGTWTQRGGEVASATSGDNFNETATSGQQFHMFVQPGGTNEYWGYVGDFKVTSLAVPEPGAALLGGLGMLCLLRRRR